MPKERAKDVRKLFYERMKREGRAKEYEEVNRRLMQETGKQSARIRWDAMKECGYLGPKDERARAKAYEDGIKAAATAADVQSLGEIARDLPERASTSVEINWVLGNTALLRSGQNRDKEINVTLADVLGPPKCPSKFALNLLVHCVNTPSEFLKVVMSELKKQVGKEGAADQQGAVSDPDLAEVERQLRELEI